MTHRTYTPDQKLRALALYQEQGLAAAWRETGIPKPNIVGWAKAAGIERSGTEQTRAATETHEAEAAALRVRLRLMLLEKAVDVLERMDAPHVEFKGKGADMVTYPIAPAGAVQNYATSAAILIDKYRLEVGEATSRGEVRDISDAFDDHEAALLKSAIEREVTARRAIDRAAAATEEVPAMEDPAEGVAAPA